MPKRALSHSLCKGVFELLNSIGLLRLMGGHYKKNLFGGLFGDGRRSRFSGGRLAFAAFVPIEGSGGGAVRYVMGRDEWVGVGRPSEVEVTVHLPQRPVLGIWTTDDDEGGAG